MDTFNDNEILEQNELSTNDKYSFLYPNLNDPNFNIKIAQKKEFNDTEYDGKIADVQTNGSYFHYHRDEVEGNYLGQVASDGSVRMWDCDDGVEKTVNYAANPWKASTAYEVGDKVQNGGKIYVCDTDGTSAGSGGPTGTGSAIADNTAKWDYTTTESAAAYLDGIKTNYDITTVQDTTIICNDTKIITTF